MKAIIHESVDFDGVEGTAIAAAATVTNTEHDAIR